MKTRTQCRLQTGSTTPALLLCLALLLVFSVGGMLISASKNPYESRLFTPAIKPKSISYLNNSSPESMRYRRLYLSLQRNSQRLNEKQTVAIHSPRNGQSEPGQAGHSYRSTTNRTRDLQHWKRWALYSGSTSNATVNTIYLPTPTSTEPLAPIFENLNWAGL